MSEKMMYVKFEKKTGDILGIKGTEYKGENSIPVPLSKVQNLISGKELMDDFEVRYDTKLKQLVFGNRHFTKIKGTHINDFIYEVPVKKLKDPDILIVQDVKNTCWKVLIGATVGDSLRRKGVNINDKIRLSVTARGDPNILYKTMLIDLGDVVQDQCVVLPFTMPFEINAEPISIFTSRKFDTYQFERILNEQ